jgi:hypothetical protein
VEVLIHALHILDGYLLPQHHLVERSNKERVQESAMEDGETDDTPDEFEVVQMSRVNAGVGIDL